MPVRRWDLNGPIYNGMWHYNQAGIDPVTIPETEIERRSSIEEHGFEMWKLGFSAHTGTYLETAAHEVPGRPSIDQVDLDRFFRPAKIVRVPTKGPREYIYPDELAAGAPPIDDGDAVLIDSGWGARWRDANFIQDTPCYHPSCLDWLMEQPMSIWGVDTPVAEADYLNRTMDWEPGERPIIVPLFKEKDILLLAPLVNMAGIQNREGSLIALPLPVEGVCATPCRAIFLEES